MSTRYLTAVLAGAFANWLVLFRFLSYSERNNMPGSTWLIFALVCLLAGFTVTWGAKQPQVRICHFLIAGVWLAHAIVIQMDWLKDPTDHNLFPFEFVFLTIAASPAYLGAAMSRILDPRP